MTPVLRSTRCCRHGFLASRCLVLGLVMGLVASQPVPALATDDDAPVIVKSSLDGLTKDRLQAAALYATGKTLYAQGDLAGALSCYQRSWRWAPDESQARDEIVALALALDLKAVAIRYALLSAESSTEVDPTLLRRLALFATQQRDLQRAARLYERWLAAGGSNKSKNRFEQLLIALETGRLRYLAGDDREASAAFATVQASLIDDREALLRPQVAQALGGSLANAWKVIARCHLDAKQTDLAKQALQQLRQLPEAQPQANYWLARVALAERRPLDAYEQMKQCFDTGAFRENDLAPQALELLSETFAILNDPAGHQRFLKQLIVGHAKSLYLKAALAQAYEQEGELTQATQLRELVIREATSEPKLPLALGGDPSPAFDSDSLSAVAKSLVKAYQNANRGELILPLVVSLPNSSRDTSLVETISKACQNKPCREAVLAALRELAANQSQVPGAAPSVALAAGDISFANRLQRQIFGTLSGGDLAEAELSWVIRLLLNEAPIQAAEVLEEGLASGVWEQEDATPYFYLSTAYAMSKQFEKALQAASEAALRAPDTADIVARKPAILMQAERNEEAIRAFEVLVQQFDTDRDPATRETLREARLSLSYLVLGTGDVLGAAEWAEQVLDEFPEHAGAKNDLGYLWGDAKRNLTRAHRMVSEAVAAEPENAAYWDSLAWVEHRRKNHAAADRAIQKSLALLRDAGDEADPEILEHAQVIRDSLRTNPGKTP